jgi:lipid-binding SYLF domain-containing protein
MNGRSVFFTTLISGLAVILSAGNAQAEWTADPDDQRQVKAEKALAEFKERIPGTDNYLGDAYGFAILPSIGRVGFGFGGSYGRGIVVEGDEMIGTTSLWQFSSGIQAGGKFFSMIIFFKDKEALDYYKESKTQFTGQAGLAVATVGLQSTPSYNDGVAILSVNRFGLMGELTAAGAKFRYKPLSDD